MCTYYEWREDGFVYRARFSHPPPTVVGRVLVGVFVYSGALARRGANCR